MKYKTLIAMLLSCALLAPAVNFATDQSSSTTDQAKSVKSSRVDKSALTDSVNINQADAKTIATLKDIGQKKAEAIVTYRTANGPFNSVDDLLKVHGISQRILAANQDRITLS